MLLATVKSVRDALGFDDMNDINEASEAALHAAAPQIASILRSEFTAGEHSAEFFIYRPGFKQGTHCRTEFLMPHGFIKEFTVSGDTQSKFSDGPIDLTANMKADLVKGHFRDGTTNYYENTVTFAYKYGFDVDETNPKSYNLTQVPEWLQEAARLRALLYLLDQPSLVEAGVKLDAKVTALQFDAIIGPRRRYAPMAFLPI